MIRWSSSSPAADGHFCAGADLTTVEDTAFTDLLHTMLDRIRTGPWVSIAAVSGAAMGGGVQLAIACDLRVADESVRFAIPAGKLGLMIDHWTVARLTGIVGQGTGRAILLGGADLRFEEAQRVGLIQRVGGLDEALAWADEITQLAPLSVLGHKISLNATEDVAFKEETSVAFRASVGQRRPPGRPRCVPGEANPPLRGPVGLAVHRGAVRGLGRVPQPDLPAGLVGDGQAGERVGPAPHVALLPALAEAPVHFGHLVVEAGRLGVDHLRVGPLDA